MSPTKHIPETKKKSSDKKDNFWWRLWGYQKQLSKSLTFLIYLNLFAYISPSIVSVCMKIFMGGMLIDRSV